MIRFNNDYNKGAHPEILKALLEINGEAYAGYGMDPWCEKAAGEILQLLNCPQAAVHFLTGGTQTNFTIISAALRPYQSVISADSGHINVHETGAVEHTGHKVNALPSNEQGKITADQIEELAKSYYTSEIREHFAQPKMVYLSFPTEYGILYSLEELAKISQVCRKYGMFLYVDGARLGYGLGSEKADVTMEDLAHLTDAFTCGGTKCGALFGEALVIANPQLNVDFRSFLKQNGAMLAKGWLLGVQFDVLFRDGLYFTITKQADAYAMRMKSAFHEAGIPSYLESFTNQQFVILPDEAAKNLKQRYTFEFEKKVDAHHSCVRFCTSWATKEEEVEALIKDIHDSGVKR